MPPKILLIHPPIAKCSEPPAGIAKLSACLTANGIHHEVIDANLEGILYLLKNASNNNNNSRPLDNACRKKYGAQSCCSARHHHLPKPQPLPTGSYGY